MTNIEQKIQQHTADGEVCLVTTEREIGMFREQLSRITRSIQLLNEGRTHSTHNGKSRLETIEEAARRVDEACKQMLKFNRE